MFTATARSVGGTLRHDVDVNGRHTIVTDEPEALGGTDAGPAPHELMAAMLAACASTMIVLYAQRRDWRLGDVRVDVLYEPDLSPREIEISVHLPTGLTPDQIERLRRVAATCPARRAFETGFTFDECFEFDLPATVSSEHNDGFAGNHGPQIPDNVGDAHVSAEEALAA
jgi:putative redox protein